MNDSHEPASGMHDWTAVALIDEARCIGCTLCMHACPVDAIVGAARLMHTVIAAECTGCRLCIPPCPVDCIDMRATAIEMTGEEKLARAARARRRSEARTLRLERDERRAGPASAETVAREKKRATVTRAIERARARLRQRAGR